MTNDYLVMLRSDQWWTTLEGLRFGPYPSQKIAVQAAIQLARLDYRRGQLARVSVDDPEDGVPVVYDSSSDPTIN